MRQCPNQSAVIDGRVKSVGLDGFVVRRESPGCRLFGTASMFEWLRNRLPPPLTGEQYGKMEPARAFYVLRGGGVFNVPLYF